MKENDIFEGSMYQNVIELTIPKITIELPQIMPFELEIEIIEIEIPIIDIAYEN